MAIALAYKRNAAGSGENKTTTAMPDSFAPSPGYPGTRGYRNNNPLNLRISGEPWRGKVSVDKNTDGVFEQFMSMPYGFRAAMINIRTQTNKGYRTLQQLINVWAPAGDGNNNPERYAATVSKRTGIAANQTIDTSSAAVMIPLASAMAYVENGSDPVPVDVKEGWNMYAKSV